MNTRKVQVYLAAKTSRSSDEKLRNIIRNNHGGNTLIEVIRAPKTFSRKGLKTLICKTHGRGVVYVFNDEFSEGAMKLATETGLSYWIVSMNNGGWTSTSINRHLGNKVAPTIEAVTSDASDSRMPH